MIILSFDNIQVEHVIREQNILAANEIIELFCELIVSRLTIITNHKYVSVSVFLLKTQLNFFFFLLVFLKGMPCGSQGRHC